MSESKSDDWGCLIFVILFCLGIPGCAYIDNRISMDKKMMKLQEQKVCYETNGKWDGGSCTSKGD